MIKNVKLEIETENEEGGLEYTDLSSPTIEMALEKLGAFERSRDKDALFEGELEQSKIE